MIKTILALAVFLTGSLLACGGSVAPDVPPTDNGTPEIKVGSESERSRARQAAEERAEKLSTRPGATADPTTLAKTRPGNEQPTPTQIPKVQAVGPSAPVPEGQDAQPMLQLFEPSKDGFGFANFAGGRGSASILVDDLVELFGADGLCIPGGAESCTPYPGVQLFLEQLNGVLGNGVCYGISASVANNFSGNLRLPDFDPATTTVSDLRRGDVLDHSIAKLHMMQFSEEYRGFLDTRIEMWPDEIAEELLSAFGGLENKLTPPYTLAIYSEQGGHSITPIGMEKTEIGYRIFVYDSNWPKETRWVDIDSGQGSWSYQALSEDKESEDELWEGEGAGSMALIPHMIPKSGFHCFFCQAPGTGVSRGTGSVITLNTTDITNVVFEMSSDAGEVIKWTTTGRSGGLAGVKTYLLPSGSESEHSKGDTLMVFIPAGLDNFEVDVNGSNSSDKNDPFELILTGPGIPTTFVKGYLSGKSEEAASKMLAFSRDLETDASDLVIDSGNVETIEAATLQSTTFVEPAEGERYESSVVEGMLKDVQIIDNETSIVVHSLKSALNAADTPLRVTETGDGLKFFKFSDGSIKIESSDGDVITKPEDGGYAVAFSDGTTASFEINEEGSMVGVFSDGSTSIRFEAGNGIHSTADGWIINEPFRGVYEVFMEAADGILESPSGEDLMELTSIARETKEVMARIMAGEFGESASSIRDDGSNAEGTLVNAAKQLEEMSEKYDFLKKVRENLAAKQPEGITAESVLRDMLGLMQSGAWSGSFLAGAEDEMPSADDMGDMDMGDMDMGGMG